MKYTNVMKLSGGYYCINSFNLDDQRTWIGQNAVEFDIDKYRGNPSMYDKFYYFKHSRHAIAVILKIYPNAKRQSISAQANSNGIVYRFGVP